MKIAHLVGFLDIRTTPPTVKRVGIYGESARSITCQISHEFPIDITQVGRATYPEACELLAESVRTHPWFAWVRTFLDARDGGTRDGATLVQILAPEVTL